MKKFLKVASAVSFCSALMMLSPISEASIISYNYDFDGVADSYGSLPGSLLSTGSFSFSYDDSAGSLSSRTGEVKINLSAISFNFNSKTYNLTTKFATATPEAIFMNGEFQGVNYVSETLANQTTVSLISDTSPYFAYDQYNMAYEVTGGGYGDITYVDITPAAPSAVPVPAAIWLFGSGLAGFGMISRRKRQLAL